jgi:hypothetical protein
MSDQVSEIQGQPTPYVSLMARLGAWLSKHRISLAIGVAVVLVPVLDRSLLPPVKGVALIVQTTMLGVWLFYLVGPWRWSAGWDGYRVGRH